MKRHIAILVIIGLWLSAAGTVVAQSTDTGAIRQRSDIDPKHQWRLADIYPDITTWEKDYARVKETLPALDGYKGRLGESGSTLLECLTLADSLWIINDRLFVYAYMKQDEDTRVADYQELSDRGGALNADVEQAVSFIRPEILATDRAKVEKFIAATPGLEVYRHYLEDILRQRAHTLSPPEEDLLAMTRDFARGFRKVFSMIDDADVKYGTVIDEEGHEVELTKQRYYKFLESTDRRLRREAGEVYNNAYLVYENTLAANLANSIKADWFYARARKYNTCLETALDRPNIPVEVYENLIASANANLAPLHRYVALRKKVLGLDTLRKYDMWVPLTAKTKVEIPYDDAVKDVLAGLRPLGKEYVEALKQGIEQGGWIDVYETEGKASGGYQWGAYSTHPYILLNYSNSINEEFTLAHEAGHAMHHYFSVRNQPYIYSDATTFTAEVASITNELLLMDYLLKKTTDPELKKYILNYQIEQFVGTFYTQCMFAEYEHALHQQIEGGEGLSATGMRTTYRDLYQRYWGSDLMLTEYDDLSGIRIGHFYRNYYVFQYATSMAAAGAIAERILSGEKDVLEAYLNFLKAGGSDYPVELLRAAGVDMTSPEPVNKAVRRFEKLIEEFEKLLS